MQLVTVNKEDYEALEKSSKYKPGKLQKIIEEFMHSDLDVMEIITSKGEYKNAEACVSSLYAACNRSPYRVRAKLIKKRLFLLRLPPDE